MPDASPVTCKLDWRLEVVLSEPILVTVVAIFLLRSPF
jgi:hypothetical protein